MKHKYVVSSVIRLPGVIFAMAASTQKLSKIYLDPVDGMRKRPMPQPPYVAATYASISATCPDTCVFRDNGCFAQNGFIRRFTRPLDLQAAEAGLTGLQVAQNEARLIRQSYGGGRVPQDGAKGGRDLRLHVGGDVSGPDAAAVLATEILRWKKRGGGDVWTFTHRWREIPVELWGRIHVWASTETAAEAVEARALGYRASITLPQGSYDQGDRLQTYMEYTKVEGPIIEHEEIPVLPCPWETRKIPCNKCRLCLRPQLPSDPVIGFVVHGSVADIRAPQEAVRSKRQLAVVG